MVYNHYNDYKVCKGDKMVKWYSEDVYADDKVRDNGLVVCIQYDDNYNTLNWQIYIARLTYKKDGIYYKLYELSDWYDPKSQRQLYEFDCCCEIEPRFLSWRYYLSKYIIQEGGVFRGSQKNKCGTVSKKTPSIKCANV